MSIAEMCTTFIKKDTDSGKLLDKNIMEFVTAPWGLGLGATPDVPPLYPSQRFILKCYYGLELDNSSNRDIIIKDQFNEVELYRFNEVEYSKYLYDEHRINVHDYGDRPNLVLVCGRRSGKCITGDSLTLTDKGIYRIEDLGEAPDEGFSPLNVGVAQESGRSSRSAYFYNGGVKDVFKIKTKDGYSINGTANHRVKVMSKEGLIVWRYLDDIKPGDYIAINRSTDLWASEKIKLDKFFNNEGKKEVTFPEELDELTARLLGYLVGDGSWGAKNALSLTVEHNETWDSLKDLYTNIFNDYRVIADKRTSNTGRLSFFSTGTRKFFHDLGFSWDCNRYNKSIPWSILRSPKSVVCSFLRGLFETDGCPENNGSYITFSTASLRLAHELQVVLLNLGIISSISEKYNKKTKRHYAHLGIKGVRSRRIFADLIGFDSDKKMLPVLESLKKAKEGKSNTESIPHQKNKIRELLDSIPIRKRGEGPGRRKLRELLGNITKNTREDLTYNRLCKSIDFAKEINAGKEELEHFRNIISTDYYYSEVVSVKESEDRVYDLNVPDGNSFVANGMTNHNTTVTACIIAYETYKLLNRYCPQEYFGIMPEDDIRITCVSTGKETATELFNRVTGHIERCEFFRKFRCKPTKQSMRLRSQRDIDKYGTEGRATITINVAPCSAKGLRGHNNIIVALDEMAFFFADEKNSGVGASDKNDRAIYNAVTPSLAKFKTPDGNPAGKVICISSPYGKTGKFYEEYERSFKEDNDDILMIQAPTWEIDPQLASKFLKNKYNENPKVYRSEFGAEFSDEICAWIEDPVIVRQNIVPGLSYKIRSFERVPHFMGIDIGLKGDGTSVVVGHWTKEVVDGEEVDKLEVDCCETRYAEEEGKDFFTPDEMAEWISEFKDRFFIIKGLMDQYYGMSIVPYLEKKGQKMFESRHFSETRNSEIYQNLLASMISSTLRLPELETERLIDGKPSKDTDLVLELLTLQSEQRGKYLIKVHAPDRDKAHDDNSDALSRMVQVAIEYKVKGLGNKISAPVGSSQAHSFKKARSRDAMRASLNRPSSSKSYGSPTRTRSSMNGPSFSRTFR